ncbi:hypothetical protein FRC12_009962 [Ceratobasidium sp. 428]|nr:hypothetical protein FRC12_009962 [Ceratobasidium sp. 428]
MARWQFNLRSGFDSDDDDSELTATSEHSIHIPPSDATTDLQPNDTYDNSTSHIPIPTTTTTEDSTSKELEQLFGTIDEETVQYKPNPWSIAKINANARATRDPAPTGKPQKSKLWNPSGRKIIPGFTHPARPPNLFFQTRVKDSRTWLPQPKAPKNSLRSVISAALRRDSAAVVSDTVTHDTGIIPDTHPPHHSGPERVELSFLPPEDALHEDRGEPPPIVPHEANSAYIPQNNTTIPQTPDTDFIQVHNTHPHFSDPEVYEGDTPTMTWDNPSSDDRPVSPIMENYPPPDFQGTSPVTTPCRKPPHNHNISPSRYLGQLSPDLRPQRVSTSPSDGFGLGGGPRPSRCSHPSPTGIPTGSRTMLEPSPLSRLMVESHSDTRYTDGHQPNERYDQDDDHGNNSPIFAYTIPSPVPKTRRFSSPYESTPARKPARAYQPYSKPESTIPIVRREPITPIQPTRKHDVTPWLDLDEEPVWSTLPSRTKKKTPTRTSPVTTARFRLPGAFLGSSSPAGEQESKRLYKPPPRKRSLEREEEGARWKVTRIG